MTPATLTPEDVFLDPSVLLLAIGGDHPWRAVCRGVLARAGSGALRIHLSVEGGQEFLFHRLRVGDRVSAVREFAALDRLAVWHPFDVDILRASRDIVASGAARGRGAVHAATAIHAGFTSIVSSDSDFDNVPGLRRIDPADL